MKKELNGEMLKTYQVPCPKDICDEIAEIEEIGYLNGSMHIRCTRCGYTRDGGGIIPTKN